MGKKKTDIRIGTSGWFYYHWQARFYPEELPKSKWFKFYTENFDTVELNSTFYHQPKESTVKGWYRQSPAGFIYAVKANRYITHIKRLKDCMQPVEDFLANAALLKEKLGIVLYQLPPSMRKDVDLLRAFIKLHNKKIPAAFEFRHKSWFDEDTYKLLERSGIAFCIHDLSGMETPRIVTGDIIYVRFHGTEGRYAGNYSDKTLKDWAKWINELRKEAGRIFVYFNNDYNAYAVANAKTLTDLVLNE